MSDKWVPKDEVQLLLMFDMLHYGNGYAARKGDLYKRLDPTKVRVDEKGTFHVEGEKYDKVHSAKSLSQI